MPRLRRLQRKLRAGLRGKPVDMRVAGAGVLRAMARGATTRGRLLESIRDIPRVTSAEWVSEVELHATFSFSYLVTAVVVTGSFDLGGAAE